MQNLLNATGPLAKYGFTDRAKRQHGAHMPNVSPARLAKATAGIVTFGSNPMDWYDQQLAAELRKELRIIDGQLVEIDVTEQLLKTDLTTTTTGVRNILFGREVLLQYSQQVNSFAMLPTNGWPSNGWGYRASTVAPSMSTSTSTPTRWPATTWSPLTASRAHLSRARR